MDSTAPNTPERVSSKLAESQQEPAATLLPPDRVAGQSFMNKDELAALVLTSQAPALGAPGTSLATATKKKRDRSPGSTGKRRRIGKASASGWKLGVEQTIGNLEVCGYTRRRSKFLEHKTDVSFKACATAVEEYAHLASQKGWPGCKLGIPSWEEGPKVFIECLIIIPHRLVGESREICEKLNALTGLSEVEGVIGSPEAEEDGNEEAEGVEYKVWDD